MARSSRIFLVRRSRDNLSAIFARRAKRIGSHGLGVLQAVSERSGRISIKNLEETERAGTDFWEIRNVPVQQWFTRNWSSDRRLLKLSRIASPGTADAVAVASLNEIIGYSTERRTGDDTGSGLSLLGGTSVTAFRMEKVNTGIEIGTDDAEAGNLLDEGGNILIGENIQSVMQLSDGTFLSVDTLEVSGVGGGGGGSSTLTGLTDTTISGPSSGQVLKYNGAKWVNDADTDTSLTTEQVQDIVGAMLTGNTETGITATYDDSDGTIDLVVTGGGSGNPVVSGAVSGTDLVLTLDDSTTVTIDVTALKNLDTSVSIASPNWYQTYASPGTGDATAGAQINTLTPSHNSNPFNFGQTLARGYEFVWSLSYDEETNYIGVWNGTTSYTPSQAGKAVYWHKHLRWSSANDEIRHGTNQYDSVGWDLSDDYATTHGTTQLALRYDYATNKLQLWDDTNDYRALICTASVAEDGNPVTISAALSSASALPNFQDTRESEWNIIAQLNAGVDTTWRDGGHTDTVIRHTRGLHPGEKMSCVTSSAWLAHYLGFDYSGAATGQTAVELQNSGSLQVGSNETLKEKHGNDGTGFTINPQATRFDSSDITSAMGGAKISFRYHLDNSFDLYDEDNEEVLFTQDADMDGSTKFLHIYFSTAVNTISYLHLTWTFEPFAPGWYYHPSSKYKPSQRFTALTFDGSSRWIFGELMYPGQELVFTETMTGSGNTYIGMRNADDTAWVRWVGFDGTKISATNEGFDIATNYSTGYTVNNKLIAMRYDHGDNKLKWYDIDTTGVETLITSATTACDGNAIRISASGNNRVPQSPVLRYYGWEFVHAAASTPQTWHNWRCDRPSINSSIRIDTALRSRRALIPGYYMRWRTGLTAPNFFMGQWKSSNGASGLSNIEATHSYWDWGWKGVNTERIRALLGMTFNTSNANYNAGGGDPYWADPDPGTTEIQWRYNSDNSIDLYDFTNSAIIATKDVDGDGNGIYLTFATGSGITTVQLADDFLGGGDVTFGTI